MNICLSKLIVASTDRVKSFNFFSFIFDADIEKDSEGVEHIRIDSIRVYFDLNIKPRIKSFGFILGLTNSEELSNFKQKLKLAYYKDAVKPRIVNEGDSFIEFKDPSGNLWRTEIYKP
jgi:hypothetical protein